MDKQSQERFVNQFFFGKENPTEEEKRIYNEKMRAYMKERGFDPETVEWKSPKEFLVEADRTQRNN